MANMIDKFMSGFGKKAELQQTSDLDLYKTKLKSVVYDDELVEELAPVFAKLAGQEGFDKVWELIETKERQLEHVAGGDWTTNTTSSDDENSKTNGTSTIDEDAPKSKTAEEILAEKYKS